ncbi:MAG: lipid-binding SYLF domain-containing protein [Gloeomargarita sp. SKYG116]|nr:lipid-binding SYLF domain-containing protein [Gloeomargarita sp. SKYG116]MCS7225473.1 lipid-binding SYLF domain-containing protein [Gloeomargarita sp. SKYB31]MDW8400559.1 lipid-binding SYLF domain-containing protein [Gloeomargarita sp. SKYGB_i_bin116]
MRYGMLIGLIPAVVITVALPAYANDAEEQIQNAADTFASFMANPNQRIPRSVLRQAQGIAILPGVTSAGFIFGGTGGSGIITVKNDNGRWSNPIFVNIAGGSVGLQVGARSSDIVLVFMNQRAVRTLLRQSFSLGGDVGVAAGPVGSNAVVPTDAPGNVDVYAYSRSAGLFAGVSLAGQKISFNRDRTEAFYGRSPLTAQTVFNDPTIPIPPVVERLHQTINRAMQ